MDYSKALYLIADRDKIKMVYIMNINKATVRRNMEVIIYNNSSDDKGKRKCFLRLEKQIRVTSANTLRFPRICGQEDTHTLQSHASSCFARFILFVRSRVDLYLELLTAGGRSKIRRGRRLKYFALWVLLLRLYCCCLG